jgi:single-stranded-DNA-specific exonuclease
VSVIHRLLDIAGIATIGDVVPLKDENRTIAKYGMYEIRSGRRQNINILLDNISRDHRTLDSYGVSYGIVPCINAAGRMGDAGNALALLNAGDAREADEYAGVLAACNSERKNVQEEATQRGMELIKTQCPGSTIPVVRDDLAHEGIIGIVAGKLSQNLGRPVIVLTEKDGSLKGSGRSIEEIDLYSIVSAHSDMLKRFGGHRAACGLTLEDPSMLDEFRKALEGEMDKLLAEDPSLLDDAGHYDLVIEPRDVNLTVAEEIERMEPFGNANEQPAFLLKDMQISRGFLMGSTKNHIKFRAERGGYTVECVSFFGADEYSDLVFREPVCDLIGRIAVNDFRGRKSAQFLIDRIIEKE